MTKFTILLAVILIAIVDATAAPSAQAGIVRGLIHRARILKRIHERRHPLSVGAEVSATTWGTSVVVQAAPAPSLPPPQATKPAKR